MAKKNIDWGNLSFGYMPTEWRYVANFKNGAWEEGSLTDQATITIEKTELRTPAAMP